MNIRKKGALLMILGTVLLFTVVLPTLFYVNTQKQDMFKKQMGGESFLLFRMYEKGESILYYIDRSAELALREVIYKYSTNAGLNDNCECSGDYCTWNKGNCWPANVKDKIISEFKTDLKGYFNAYPEKLSEITYNFESKDNSLIGKTDKKLRMDITEGDIFNFEISEEPTFKEGEDTESPGKGGNILASPIPYGKCSALAEYGTRYVGCAYALNDLSGRYSPPEQCDKGFNQESSGATYTCAGLTSSIVYNVLHIYYGGNGRDKCDQNVVHKLPKDVSILQSGDFAAIEARCTPTPKNVDWCKNGYTTAGHVAMYMGRGSVSNNAYGRITCYLTFTPDPNGEPVFIHSNGGEEHGKPGVCYATYNQLFVQNSIFVLKDFCRLNACGQ
jgi:hypothetical protein